MRHPTCIVVRRLARVESAHRCTAVGNAGRCGLRLSAEPKAACSQRDESSRRVRPVRAERDCGVRAGGAMRVAAYGMRTGGLQPAEAGDSGPPRGEAAGCAAVRRSSVGGEGGCSLRRLATAGLRRGRLRPARLSGPQEMRLSAPRPQLRCTRPRSGGGFHFPSSAIGPLRSCRLSLFEGVSQVAAGMDRSAVSTCPCRRPMSFGRCGSHLLSYVGAGGAYFPNRTVLGAPRENKKGARCQPLITGLRNLNPEAVLRPCLSHPRRAGHNKD